ncbi:MAG: carbohydrate binding family 9 domain-containing protein, partial [Phycisphaeraceae bacterium]|nr:carbohydrate binding family 9 domain-containing protein [Phycisphaeraceae bacterium]
MHRLIPNPVPRLLRSRSRSVVPLAVIASIAAAGGATVAVGQIADPVAAGDDEAATILADALPAASGAPRIFGVDEAPEIDGVLEEIWQDGTLLEDTWRQVNPDEGAMPTQRTEIRLMRDAQNLYVGVRCFDDEPSKIISRVMIRGGSVNRDDNILMVLDPKRDLRTGYIFRMNPNGARADARLVNGRTDYDWDGQWYGRSSIDDEGWTAEFVVPFRTISIDASNPEWGINFERTIRRNNETVRWQSADRDVSINSVADAGVVEMFGDIDQGSGIDVRPYGKITVSEDDGVDVAGTGGVDVFWKVTP